MSMLILLFFFASFLLSDICYLLIETCGARQGAAGRVVYIALLRPWAP